MKRNSPFINPFWKQTTAKRKKPLDNPFKRKYQIPLETWAFEDFLSNDDNRSNSKNQNNSIIKNIADGVSNVSRNIVDGAVVLAKKVAHAVKGLPFYVNYSEPSMKPEVLVKFSSEDENPDPEDKNRKLVPVISPKLHTNMQLSIPTRTFPFLSGHKNLQISFLNIPPPTSPWGNFNPNQAVLTEFQKFNGPPSQLDIQPLQLLTLPSQDADPPSQDDVSLLLPKVDILSVDDDRNREIPNSKVIISSDPDHIIIKDENIPLPDTLDEIVQFETKVKKLLTQYGQFIKVPMKDDYKDLRNEFDDVMKIFDAMSKKEEENPIYSDLLKRYKNVFDYYHDDLSNFYAPKQPDRYEKLIRKLRFLQDHVPEIWDAIYTGGNEKLMKKYTKAKEEIMSLSKIEKNNERRARIAKEWSDLIKDIEPWRRA